MPKMPTPKLPKSLSEIARLAGEDVAFSLALACGGRRVYVPNKIEGSTLERLLGVEMARKLARHMPGCSIPVPVAREAVTLWLYDQGLSVSQIADRLRCNQRTISSHVARHGKKIGQNKLSLNKDVENA